MPPSGRFQAPRCAAHTEKKERAVNDLWEGESPRRFAAPPFDKGGLWRERDNREA